MKFTVFSMPTFDDALGLNQGEFLRALVDHLATADERIAAGRFLGKVYADGRLRKCQSRA